MTLLVLLIWPILCSPVLTIFTNESFGNIPDSSYSKLSTCRPGTIVSGHINRLMEDDSGHNPFNLRNSKCPVQPACKCRFLEMYCKLDVITFKVRECCLESVLKSYVAQYNASDDWKTTWGIDNFLYYQDPYYTIIWGAIDRGNGWKHIGFMIVLNDIEKHFEKMQNCTAFNRFVVKRFVNSMSFISVIIMLSGFMALVIAGMIFGRFFLLVSNDINDIAKTKYVTVTSTVIEVSPLSLPEQNLETDKQQNYLTINVIQNYPEETK